MTDGVTGPEVRPQWLITKDLVEDSRQVGHCSYGWTDTLDAKHNFKIYDDDDNLLYEGKATEETFAPLDEFAEPNAGATEIHYEQPDGEYVKL